MAVRLPGREMGSLDRDAGLTRMRKLPPLRTFLPRWGLRRPLLVGLIVAVGLMLFSGAGLSWIVATNVGRFSVCSDPHTIQMVVPGQTTVLWQSPLHPVLKRLTPARIPGKQPPFFRCYYLVRSAGGTNRYAGPGSAPLRPGIYGVEMDIYGYYVYGSKGHETASPSTDSSPPPTFLMPLPSP